MSSIQAPPRYTTTSLADQFTAMRGYSIAIIIASGNSFTVDLDQACGMVALA